MKPYGIVRPAVFSDHDRLSAKNTIRASVGRIRRLSRKVAEPQRPGELMALALEIEVEADKISGSIEKC